LSLAVIKLRHREPVSLGDGGCVELETRIAAQSNAIEYLPISLLMLFALKMNGAQATLLHGFGIVLLSSRVLHARAMFAQNFRLRVRAMQLTFCTLIGLALVNLWLLPYGKLL